jgi:hypothetical protein
VFVKLERYTGTQLSIDVDKHNIVPFTCVHEIRLTVNGTHEGSDESDSSALVAIVARVVLVPDAYQVVEERWVGWEG